MKREKRDLIFLVLGIFLSFQLSVVQAAELKFGFTPVLGEAEMREEFQPPSVSSPINCREVSSRGWRWPGP